MGAGTGDHLDLSGTWRAAPADEDLRRRYPDDGFDDGAWERVAVPGHWRSVPAFAGADGPFLYRRRFEAPPPGPGQRTWLVLDGVFSSSDVWLDGAYVGDTEGYFFPHAFEVTERAAARAEHVLAVEVACTPPADRRRKRSLTGVFQHWDMVDRDANVGGLWRPVRWERTGPVRVERLRALCREADEASATVVLRAVLDSDRPRPVELRTTVHDPTGRELLELTSDQHLAAGPNRIEWAVAVPEPRLWWPWALGDQPRYDVTVEVLDGGVASDRRHRRIGLRQVAVRRWRWSVNGERLFLKGANVGPTRLALAEATPGEVAGDVALAREAGLDLLRVHGHVARPELYEAADRAGVLLWQDLPLQWGYARTVRGQARRQAREAVDLLGHHPSVAVWCGHNAPFAVDMGAEALADRRRRRRLVARTVAGQLLPTWNKTVLDRSVASVLARSDGTRPVVPHSGVLPHLPAAHGTDSHLFVGWYAGDRRDLPGLLRWWPRLARFVGELGAQAVPDDAGFLEPERWPDLDWDRAARVHGLQKAVFDRHVPPARHATFEAWRDATQAYQADLVRRQVEALRRLKYRPAGGFAQFCLADAQPAVSWSVLDHRRRPKAGWSALAAACQPVVVVADEPPAVVAPGQRLRLDVHAVSDQRILFEDMIVEVHLSWRESDGNEGARGGRQERRAWTGDLPADSCAFVGTVDAVVPATADALRLDLELRSADGAVVAANRYEAAVAPGPAPARRRRRPWPRRTSVRT